MLLKDLHATCQAAQANDTGNKYPGSLPTAIQVMPSKSVKQARTMAAAAHDPKFAKKVGIPEKVAKEFNQADAGTGIIAKKQKRKRKY